MICSVAHPPSRFLRPDALSSQACHDPESNNMEFSGQYKAIFGSEG